MHAPLQTAIETKSFGTASLKNDAKQLKITGSMKLRRW